LLGRDVHERVGVLLKAAEPEQQEETMEAVSVLLADELRRQGLSESPSDFLLDHAPRVQANITDARLRQRLRA
jgi:hypothetical protein